MNAGMSIGNETPEELTGSSGAAAPLGTGRCQRRSCGHQAGRQLALTPEVGAELPAGALPLRDPMDLKSSVLSPTSVPPLDLVDKGNTKSEGAVLGHLAEKEPFRGGEQAGESHALNLDIMSKFVNTCPTRLFVEPWDNPSMEDEEDIYPKRPLFKEWVAIAKAKLHATNNATVAPIMGYTPSTLNKMLGKSTTHKPSPEALKLLGDFIDRDYRLLLDDPNLAPPGISKEAWADASNRDRVLASAMLEDLKAIPEEEKDAYYNLWKQGVAIGRARMAAEGKVTKLKVAKGGKKP